MNARRYVFLEKTVNTARGILAAAHRLFSAYRDSTFLFGALGQSHRSLVPLETQEGGTQTQ